MVNFKNRIINKNKPKITNPIELYEKLDRKSIAGPLRPVQEYALKEWFEKRREDKDLIIKLHTGEGKTLIGLLILQSAINLAEGPCIYICPNIYLVNQVCEEAKKFGIPYCVIDENGIPDEYETREKILITHAQKIFNGKSIFGLGNKFVAANTVILDDSHACIDVLKDVFNIKISKESNETLYNQILTLFSEDLREQGEGSYLDIESGESDTFMLVPYWAWDRKKTEILTILSESKSIEEIKFSWPLIKDRIIEFACYISGNRIEITPYNPNVEPFGTFNKAKRRILMSATTQEDSFFIKGLNFSVEAVTNPISYPNSRWSGEKMILMPSLIDDECDRNLVATKFGQMANKNIGIVVIVPNTKIANYYRNLGALVPKDNSEVLKAIGDLRGHQFGKTVVINNRYDGIDLPDESCRILVIDSMPFLSSYSDKYEELCCPNSEIISKRFAQKIEQGIGRAVRGEKDYCAILIIGSNVEKFMRSSSTRAFFSNQTRKQIEIGFQVAKMAKEEKKEDDSPIQPIYTLINQMLKRDEGWKDYYTTMMDDVTFESSNNIIYERYEIENELEQLFFHGEYEEAASKTQKYIDKYINDTLEKGWYLERMARYTYMFSKEQSIELQKAAFKLNPQVLIPNNNIKYSKITTLNEHRITNFKEYISKFSSYEDLLLSLKSSLEDLSFGMNSEKFERALHEIGEFLGYECQRPDKMIRKGPDNLWGVTKDHYVMFECKNKVNENRQSIDKKEAGQFNNHCAWFKNEYGKNTNCRYIMIIPTRNLAYEANFAEKVFVMRKNGLKRFKDNIKAFLKEIKNYDLNNMSDIKIQSYFDLYKLNVEDFYDSNYIEDINHLKK